MHLNLFSAFLFFVFSVTFVSAKPFAWNNIQFSIDVPKAWREVKDLYGIPVTLLGPSVSPKPRAIIQITPTTLPSSKWTEADAKSFGETYGEGRKKWLKEQNGELLELRPGKLVDGRLVAGVSYKLGAKRYLERTHYINCPKQIFHLKIVLNFENLDSLSEADDVVRSFACDK